MVEAAGADVVVFDNDLSPGQARNLEKALGVKVLDRSEIILDIFANRAQTIESRHHPIRDNDLEGGSPSREAVSRGHDGLPSELTIGRDGRLMP